LQLIWHIELLSEDKDYIKNIGAVPSGQQETAI